MPQGRDSLDLQNVIETIPALVLCALPDGTVEFVNRAWQEYTGYSPQQLTDLGWRTLVHPDDLAKFLNEWNIAFVAGRPFETEARIQRADGQYRWFLIKKALAISGKRNGHPSLRTLIAFEDISDRKHSQIKLQQSEARYRLLIETLSDAVVSVSEHGVILFANLATASIFGYEPKELIGKQLTVLMPEFLRKQHEHGFQRYLATGQRHIEWQGSELTGLRKNGQEFPVEVSFGEILTESGHTFTGFIRDVSARKRAEENLRRSETYLAEAQSVTHTGSCAIDGTSRQILYWSDEMFRLFAFDPKQGLPLWDQWVQRIHPEDLVKFQMAGDKTFRERVHCDIEFRIVKPDGTVRHIHAIGHPISGPSGELAQVIGTMVDVTDQRRAEEEGERLRQAQRMVVQTATDAVVSADENGVIQFANPATMRVFGYDAEELIGKPLTVLMPEYLRKLHEHGFGRYLATGQRHLNWQGTELTGLRKNGQEFPVEVSFGELTMNDHRVFTGFIRDISERKRAEGERERLRQVQAELAHIHRVSTMGELTAALAHDVKQPIAAAVTNAKTCLRWLSRDQPDLMEARDAASRLVKDVTRASDIISRIGSLFKKGLPRREMVNVNEVIREMIALLRSEAERHSISIDGDLARDVPLIMVDRVQLQQVLMNLMLNGIEAMTDLSIPGRLTITSQHQESRQLLISVADVGSGIRPEQKDQIFHAFFTSKPQGTGMGLAISRSIIEAHGGRLWATPNSGPGTTFHFTLPIEAAASEVA